MGCSFARGLRAMLVVLASDRPARAIGICGAAYSISPSAVFSRPVRRDEPFRSAIREQSQGAHAGAQGAGDRDTGAQALGAHIEVSFSARH
jgi:anti-sigma factor RsiW